MSSVSLIGRLADVVGRTFVTDDPDVVESRSVDITGRYHGTASILVRPGSTEEVADVVTLCRTSGQPVTIQGGRTSLVAGTVPENSDVLLSTERLTTVSEIDVVAKRVRVGSGVTLAALQTVALRLGLEFGVDLASRDSATLGGMAATNAGGLRTVGFGNMSAQVLGIEVVLPDGKIVSRRGEVLSDNTGYDLISLWVGSEGTLGVITELDLALHSKPEDSVVLLLAFHDLSALLVCAETWRGAAGLRALELVDVRGVRLAQTHLGGPRPPTGEWVLLVEVDTSGRSMTDIMDRMDGVSGLSDEPRVADDASGRARLWKFRESFAEVVGLFGPPVKFDVSLPKSAITEFAQATARVISERAPSATAVLFGHVGEGNLHLNVLNCSDEAAIYGPVMEVIRTLGGNVSSEHGVGTRKREYLDFTRSEPDIAVMRLIKQALDPDWFLNPSVLFTR